MTMCPMLKTKPQLLNPFVAFVLQRRTTLKRHPRVDQTVSSLALCTVTNSFFRHQHLRFLDDAH